MIFLLENKDFKDDEPLYKIPRKEKKEFLKLIKKVRKNIPKIYNQIKLAEDLIEPSIDWLISISNRTDGKTTNYIHLLVILAIELDLKFSLLARHYTLRITYQNTLMDIFLMDDKLDESLLTFRRTDLYTIVMYKNKPISVITDINSATDLKNDSNYLKHFPIMVYDEFLALEDDYVFDEWGKVKTIFESIDRQGGKIPYIGFPRILLLGNAVNFSSPLLLNLNLFNKLETQEMNTKKTYDTVSLEMNTNENANKTRHTRTFGMFEDDPMTTGRFSFNNFGIIKFEDKVKKDLYCKSFNIKHGKEFLKISFDEKDPFKSIYLSILPFSDNFIMCTENIDKKIDNIVISDSFYSKNFFTQYEQGNILFENSYTKEKILNDNNFTSLNIYKIVSYYLNKVVKKRTEQEKYLLDEQEYRDLQLQQTKKWLFNKFLGDIFE